MQEKMAMSRMAEKKEKPVSVLFTPQELSAIDDWRFKNRIASRGEAIRQLIRLGFNAAFLVKNSDKPEK